MNIHFGGDANMMSWVIVIMVVLSVIAALVGGDMAALSAATMGGCKQAIELAITLAATMSLWSGVMKVAERSGLTAAIARALLPITKGVLFPSLGRDSSAMQAISMNLTANLLGLGNAATPLGIAAMRELEREAGYPATATRDMITFVALNTASMQLIPTTTAFLRLQAGSASPMEIIVPVWVSSLVAVTVAVLVAKALFPRAVRSAQ